MNHTLSWEIYKFFSLKGSFGFSAGDVQKAFPKGRPAYLSQVLSGMVRKGMVKRLAVDLYHIVPANKDPETYEPDSVLVAKYLIGKKPYYLGYASALKIHGIRPMSYPPAAPSKELSHSVEQVVTKVQVKPALRKIGNTSYQFICKHSDRFFGFESIPVDATEKINASDLEKTIVDIAGIPSYAGGIYELGYALVKGRERINPDRLLFYLSRNRVLSSTKRILFLTDLLGLEWTDGHKQMMQELGRGMAFLDPSGPREGRRLYRYGLRLNIDPIDIKNRVLQHNMEA